MEGAIRARSFIRREFDSVCKKVEELVVAESLDEDEVDSNLKVLSRTFKTLSAHDNKVFEALNSTDVPEEECNRLIDEMTGYRQRFELVNIRARKRLPTGSVAASTEVIPGSSIAGDTVQTLKLPTVTLKKFNGELKQWLGFWAQYQRIHDDPNLSNSDKFWYLSESLIPGTEAHLIASCYPHSGENYPKLVEALKKRYGNEDMLLQVYIREMLSLVITNANKKDKIPVEQLYPQVSSHLRALKSLNLQKADPDVWLFPLVESCLPDRILYNWQREPASSKDNSTEPPISRLDQLMEFCEKEVQIQQQIKLSRSFAQQQQKPIDSAMKRPTFSGKRMSTVSSLHVGTSANCLFCGRKHETAQCLQARRRSEKERIETLSKNKLCFRCCQPSHIAKECKNKLECLHCQGSHATALCRGGVKKTREEDDNPNKRPRWDIQKTSYTQTSSNHLCGTDVTLQTVAVKLTNNGTEKIVRAFIDSGSERSYLLSTTATELDLKPTGVERVIHCLFGNETTSPKAHQKFSLNVCSIDEQFQFAFEVRGSTDICGSLPRPTMRNDNLREELKRRNISLADCGKGCPKIELLIGADMYCEIATGEMQNLDVGGIAINTKLGWTLLGNTNGRYNSKLDVPRFSNVALQASLASLWELETLGIRDPVEVESQKVTEEKCLQNFQRDIRREADRRYSVKLPWKEDHPPLPTNREVAFKRLQATSKKLLDNKLFKVYSEMFQQWVQEGFIEDVTSNVLTSSASVHYLPHRAVVKDSKTTPVRPVFDGSCRSKKSPSLNDCLVKGRNYIQLIPDILLKFREKKVGFVSDIRKAFQMISVDERDRDAMRFLWWKSEDMNEIIEYRHTRVMFGATCSPFILGAVLQQHLTNATHDKEIASELLDTMYVDNCVSSANSNEEYRSFKNKATALLKEAQMDLRDWMSNCEELDDEETRMVSVLGLQWDRKEDTLSVLVKDLQIPEKITKRVVLSSIQKIFDPIGFTSPAILPMKILLQRSFLSKKKWDEELSEEDSKLFKNWVAALKSLESIRLPRLATAGETNRAKWSLHTFTDASTVAYGAITLLRVQLNGYVHIQLLGAKSRVAPLKPVTVPRLELLGCLVGARLADSVGRSLDFTGVTRYFWTDSTTALAWIVRNENWGTFVGNRTKEIANLTDDGIWRHVPGTLNPADLPSRGCTFTQLLASKWWEGPHWLHFDEADWPGSSDKVCEAEADVYAEVRQSSTNVQIEPFVFHSRLRCQHSFERMVRIVAWVRRFLHNKYTKGEQPKRTGELTKEERLDAERALIRSIQKDSFPMEVRKHLRAFELFEDENRILRVKTKLTYGDQDRNFKFPILLPGYRGEVKQLIKDMHRYHCHARTENLQSIIRKKYWIQRPRKSIQHVISKCLVCRKITATSAVAEPSPLPLDRIREAEVFEVIGVDLAGPLTLRNGKKVWITIFTCAVYRAIHQELISSLSTKAFINVLHKFVQKYRRPSIIYSDNGTNFHGSNNLFKNLDWTLIKAEENVGPIIWKFNPATASWWGGFFERLIGTVKNLLRKSIGKASLSVKELDAVLREVTNVMNDRPLTAVNQSPDDLEPLTPSLFLHPFGNVKFPEADLTVGQNLQFRYNHVKALQLQLKQRFEKEYLAYLVNRRQSKSASNLRVGDLVLIGADNKKRADFPLGRILELMPGADGHCRVARIKTERGECVRPVQRLYPLELDVAEEEVRKDCQQKVIRTRSGRLVKPPNVFK